MHNNQQAAPSRWWTKGFIIHHILMWTLLFAMIYGWIAKSSEYGDVREGKLQGPKIRPGWFMGRYMDRSDPQWMTFRKFFPTLFVSLAIFVAVSNSIKHIFRSRTNPQQGIQYTLWFYTISNLGFLFYVHRYDTIWLILISMANYWIAKTFAGSKWNPLLTWTLNVSMLFLTDHYKGFKFMFPLLGIDLPNLHGELSWNTYFKMTVLRHISFNMDYYWAVNSTRTVVGPPTTSNKRPKSPYEMAQDTPQPLHQYSWLQFFAYTYYVPLFIAGPIIPFNAFIAQVVSPQTAVNIRQKVWMLSRVLVEFVFLEIFLHFCYQNAFTNSNLWKDFSPIQVAITGFGTLNYMWLKFMIIWRFFRTVAFFDDIEVPENMNRCINNNNSFSGFWRSWHASLNKWIVRYIYVPLGGSRTQGMSVWLIFSFVGLWHDLKWRWLAWAWCNCVFMTLELIVVRVMHSEKFSWLRRKSYYNDIAALGAVFDIFMLCVAKFGNYAWF